jgi:glyoxylase-like metal-dependent hydrolase (beta-lactamase superfamily II)
VEVYPQVHCYATRAVNCYLCVEEEGLTLVDASTPNQADKILNYVQRIGRQPWEIRRIVITHTDRDHVGSLAEIQGATGATVFAGEASIAWLQQGMAPPHLPRPMQFVVDRLLKYEPLPANVLKAILPGELLPVLGGLQAIATPGHTPDHCSYYSRMTGVLFAGDALSTRGGRVGLSPGFITADKEATRQSAQTLLGLAPALIACGHGSPLQSHTMTELMDLLQKLK